MAKTILIIDDDPGIVDVLQLILEEAGYRVETQMDGHAAEQLTLPLPDLVLLDIRVSGTHGGTLCHQFKSQSATQSIPIILLSAHQEGEQIAREAGADAFLAKPFEMGDILSLTEKYAGKAS
ncbi:MAG TPA: response regulator [Ktedonobacteraceae bacterium]|nr:response regulator [Ktedonobacteraceae bacterium]